MIIMLNIELSISITRKFVISFQTASLSELECKLFLLPVSAAILNLSYITRRTFTHIGLECARVSPFTVFMQSSMKVSCVMKVAAILVFGLLLAAGGMKIHFAPRLKGACGAEHVDVLQSRYA